MQLIDGSAISGDQAVQIVRRLLTAYLSGTVYIDQQTEMEMK